MFDNEEEIFRQLKERIAEVSELPFNTVQRTASAACPPIGTT
jgi:hypothetical protein